MSWKTTLTYDLFCCLRVLVKTEKDFAAEKDRKELPDTEKDFDMACYAIKCELNDI